MDFSNTPANPNLQQDEGPKDNTSGVTDNSPPPAYTPRRIVDLSAIMAQAASRPRSSEDLLRQAISLRRQTEVTSIDACDEAVDLDEESIERSSPISLRINTSINITSNDNLVCIQETPQDHAVAIAQAVVKSMKDHSSGNCGIPMIDEDGHPRPINIEVDASLAIEGSGNVLGNEQVVRAALQSRPSLRRRRQFDEEEEVGGPSKRRRGSE